MRVIGLFREFVRPQNTLLPSIHDSRDALAEDMVLPVLEYLSKGTGVIDFMEYAVDLIDRSRGVSGGPGLISDGEWVWRIDLAHYVRSYRIGLPEEFLSRVRRAEIEPVRKLSVLEVADDVLETYAAAERGDARALLY